MTQFLFGVLVGGVTVPTLVAEMKRRTRKAARTVKRAFGPTRVASTRRR